MDKAEIMRWLETLADDSTVCIHEDGLSIVEVGADGLQTEAYLELGMTPEENAMLNGNESD